MFASYQSVSSVVYQSSSDGPSTRQHDNFEEDEFVVHDLVDLDPASSGSAVEIVDGALGITNLQVELDDEGAADEGKGNEESVESVIRFDDSEDCGFGSPATLESDSELTPNSSEVQEDSGSPTSTSSALASALASACTVSCSTSNDNNNCSTINNNGSNKKDTIDEKGNTDSSSKRVKATLAEGTCCNCQQNTLSNKILHLKRQNLLKTSSQLLKDHSKRQTLLKPEHKQEQKQTADVHRYGGAVTKKIQQLSSINLENYKSSEFNSVEHQNKYHQQQELHHQQQQQRQQQELHQQQQQQQQEQQQQKQQQYERTLALQLKAAAIFNTGYSQNLNISSFNASVTNATVGGTYNKDVNCNNFDTHKQQSFPTATSVSAASAVGSATNFVYPFPNPPPIGSLNSCHLQQQEAANQSQSGGCPVHASGLSLQNQSGEGLCHQQNSQQRSTATGSSLCQQHQQAAGNGCLGIPPPGLQISVSNAPLHLPPPNVPPPNSFPNVLVSFDYRDSSLTNGISGGTTSTCNGSLAINGPLSQFNGDAPNSLVNGSVNGSFNGFLKTNGDHHNSTCCCCLIGKTNGNYQAGTTPSTNGYTAPQFPPPASSTSVNISASSVLFGNPPPHQNFPPPASNTSCTHSNNGNINATGESSTYSSCGLTVSTISSTTSTTNTSSPPPALFCQLVPPPSFLPPPNTSLTESPPHQYQDPSSPVHHSLSGLPPPPSTLFHQNQQQQFGCYVSPSTSSPTLAGDHRTSLIGMKRMSEMNEVNMANDSSPTKRSRSAGDMEIRMLIQSKTAGSIIGKGGSNISRLRSEYPATISIPDCPGPERVLSISGAESSVVKVLEEVLSALDEAAQRSGESDIRVLVHQSQAGAIIGKGGAKIKELRELCGGQVKVFSNCCPQSSDRVIQVAGDQQRVLLTTLNIFEALKDTTIKGIENPYSPYNYDEFYSLEYGGWGEGPKGRFPPMGGRGPLPPMSGPPGGPMGGRGPMGPGGPFGNSGGLPPFGDRRRGNGGGPGPFSPPRSGPPMRGGDDFDDMMPGNGGGNKGGFMNGNSLMGQNGDTITTSTQVTIPKDAAGAIIGKGGARIRKIRADSCCSISIEDARPGSDDRIITITGGEQQIKHAQYLLQQSVREFGGPIGRRNNY